MSLITNAAGALRKFSARISHKNRVLAGLVLACLVSTGTLMATAPQHDPNVVEEKDWPVSQALTRVQTLSPELQLFGRVETPRHAQLSAGIAAQVNQLHIGEGQRVTQGQLLISLDKAEEELALQQREAELAESVAQLQSTQREIETDKEVLQHMLQLHELTKSKADRLRTLNSKNLIATERLENTLQEVATQGIQLARAQAKVDNNPQSLARAEAAVSKNQALLQRQRINLDRTEIRAPFAGRISKVSVSPGDRVQRGQILIALYDTNALQIRVPMPSSAIATVKGALQREIPISARINGQALTATLEQLASEVGRGESGVDGLFNVEDMDGELELGRAVELTITLPASENMIALPLQSVYNNKRVYVIEQGRLRGVDISPAGQRINRQGKLEILVHQDTLVAGVPILASNLPKASTGLKVQVINSSRQSPIQTQ